MREKVEDAWLLLSECRREWRNAHGPAHGSPAASTCATPVIACRCRRGRRSGCLWRGRSGLPGLPCYTDGPHRPQGIIIHLQALHGGVLPSALADLEAALLAERACERGMLQDCDD